MSLGLFNDYSQTSLMGAPKCEDLVFPYGIWLLRRSELKRVYSKKSSRHAYPLEGNFKTAYNFKVTIYVVLYCR